MKRETQKVKIKQYMPEDLGAEECTKYRDQIANDDPQELERERKRVLFKLSIYGKGMFGKDFINQMKPMVENMSVADCKNLSYNLDTKGKMGLIQMLKRHQKEVERQEKEKANQTKQAEENKPVESAGAEESVG